MRDGGVVASVGDAAVRARDVALLRSRPPAWLNDALLALYLQRLQLSAAAPAVLLVAPAVAAWLRLCRDASDLRLRAPPPEPRCARPTPPSPPSRLAFSLLCIDLCRLPENVLSFREAHRIRQLVLFPVNDNDDPDVPEGGTHWSLLMYYRLDGAFTHLDSLGDANRLPAQALVDVIAPFLGVGGYKPTAMCPSLGAPLTSCAGYRVVDQHLRPGLPTTQKANPVPFHAAPRNSQIGPLALLLAGVPQAKRLCVPDFTPQQCNGYECGDFVLAMAEAIVTAHSNGEHPLSTLKTSNFIGRVSNLREDFYELVQELQQERAKRVA
eukprot:SM000314S12173  [mRNA]  locus=s314:2640:3847:+ [translate_table: standard]